MEKLRQCYELFMQCEYMRDERLFLYIFPKFKNVDYDKLEKCEKQEYIKKFFNVILYYTMRLQLLWQHYGVYDSYARGDIEKTIINICLKYCNGLSDVDICLNPDIALDLFKNQKIFKGKDVSSVVKTNTKIEGVITYKNVAMFVFYIALKIKDVDDTKYIMCSPESVTYYSPNSLSYGDYRVYVTSDNNKFKLKHISEEQFCKYSQQSFDRMYSIRKIAI